MTDREKELNKKIEEFNKKTIHFLWTVFISMVVAIITSLLLIKLGL
ncbi:MAG: hypothetical protein LIO87_09175 [Eubacterium sp.]|nr:hypothetical protein [Eubacterium sp.]